MQQRLSRRHERYLYLTGTLLAVSGVGWLIEHYLLRPPGVPTLGPHPSEAWWMRLHGAAVIGFLVAFGALLPGHIVQNWRQRANRYSGLTIGDRCQSAGAERLWLVLPGRRPAARA